MLESLVTSLHFNGHSRWGIQPPPKLLQEIIMGFLTWMRESKEWTRLESDWRKAGGPWSLPLMLSRSFTRYRENELIKPAPESSLLAARALLELPTPRNASAAPVTEALLDVFSSLTHHLPHAVRLPYQLHLEGLLDHEIAPLIGASAAEVTARIAEAKAQLQGDVLKRSSRT